MYEKQERLFKWGYVINCNESQWGWKWRAHRYDINRPRPRYRHKYTKYKMCLIIKMVIGIKQHLKLNSRKN